MKIALLHTADIHVATFDALLANNGAELTHIVRPDLLRQAREVGLDAVWQDTTSLLSSLASADAVLCSCSTLGPIVDEVSKQHPNIIRIDRPLMERACSNGPDILVAICLDSTRAPSLSLLQDCAVRSNTQINPRVLLCKGAWPAFERGDERGFAGSIAATIRNDIDQHGTPDCIVLAQASMQVAVKLLGTLNVPILTSPPIAAQRVLQVAQGKNALG